MKKQNLTEALKFDSDKVRMDLLPPDALRAVAEVLTYGANKYAERNWESRGGMKWGRLYAATQRHLASFWECDDIDEETSLLHLSHAACDIIMLLAYQLRKTGIDDRFPLSPAEEPSYTRVESPPTTQPKSVSFPFPSGEQLAEARKTWEQETASVPTIVGHYDKGLLIELAPDAPF